MGAPHACRMSRYDVPDDAHCQVMQDHQSSGIAGQKPSIPRASLVLHLAQYADINLMGSGSLVEQH